MSNVKMAQGNEILAEMEEFMHCHSPATQLKYYASPLVKTANLLMGQEFNRQKIVP